VTKDNINKPNPKHYKFELKNVPVIIDGKEMVVDSLQLETRYILKDLLNDAKLTHEQAFWYGNIGKRYFRLCKKHDDPTTDVNKIIQNSNDINLIKFKNMLELAIKYRTIVGFDF